MLFFKSYGIKKSIIGVDEYLIKYPSCETDSWADVMVMSDYYHFGFIPIFPTDKETVVFCKKCGLRRYGMAFDEKLISNFKEVKHKYKHPWYSYIGISIAALIILLLVIMVIST